MIKIIILAFILGTAGTYIRLQFINIIKNPNWLANNINSGLLLANITGCVLALLLIDLNPVYTIAFCGAMTSVSALIKASYHNLRYLFLTYILIFTILKLFEIII